MPAKENKREKRSEKIKLKTCPQTSKLPSKRRQNILGRRKEIEKESIMPSYFTEKKGKRMS